MMLWNSAVNAFASLSPLAISLVCLGGFYLLVALVGLISRKISKRGQIITKRVITNRSDHYDPNKKIVLDLAAVSGDAIEVIADEMFPADGTPHSYIKHGIVLPTKLARDGQPALVVDVGANVGLFGVSMKYLCDIDVASRPKLQANRNNNSNNTSSTAKSPATKRATSVRGSPRGAGRSGKKEQSAAAVAHTCQNNDDNANNNNNYLAPSVRVVGFEPIPETFECARQNFSTYFAESNQRCIDAGRPLHASRVLQLGIGRAPQTVTFHYDPAFSAMASMAKAEITAAIKTAPLQLAGAALQDMKEFGLRRLHQRSLLNDCVYRPLLLAIGIAGTLFRTPIIKYVAALLSIPIVVAGIIWRVTSLPVEHTTECHIEPLPAALKRVGADDPATAIALLKVDVEGAEEEVLLGIDDITWSRVHQCVVEIHQTPDRRVERLVALLKEKGFKRVVIDTEEFAVHAVCELKTVFATRH